jgi:hypothetical protein
MKSAPQTRIEPAVATLWWVLMPASALISLTVLDAERPEDGFIWAIVASVLSLVALFLAGYAERRNTLAPACLAAIYLFGIYPLHGIVTFGDAEVLDRIGSDAEYWRAVAALWVAVGTPFFWLGFRSGHLARLFGKLPAPSWYIPDDGPATVSRALVASAFGWVARLASYVLGFHFHQVSHTTISSDSLAYQFIVTLLSEIPLIMMIYLMMISVIRKRRLTLLTLVLPLLALELAWGLISGSRFKMLLPLAGVAIALSRAHRPVSLPRAVAGLAVFVAILFPLATGIRTGLVNQQVEIQRGGFSGETVGRSVASAFDDDPDTRREEGALALLGERLHGLTSFALIIRYTPERHPYRLGKQFFMTPFMMAIPRLIWPDKPQPAEFTMTFKKLYWGHHEGGTSIATSQLGGFWSNFGFVGVFLGMWLSGLLYGYLVKDLRFGTDGRSLFPLAVTSTLVISLIQTFENEFEPVIEAMPKKLLIYFLLAWWLSRSASAQARATRSNDARAPGASNPPRAVTASNRV